MARPRTVHDDTVVAALATTFRATGYDGASMTTLSAAAGLRSASLYHRFPGGKTEMAMTVLDDVGRQFGLILEPLGSGADPSSCVVEMAGRLAQFYADGRLACLLDTMTLGGAPDEVVARARALGGAWVDAMTDLAVRAGLDEPEGRRRAVQAFARVEGSLVVARVLADPAEFLATLDALPHLLTGK